MAPVSVKLSYRSETAVSEPRKLRSANFGGIHSNGIRGTLDTIPHVALLFCAILAKRAMLRNCQNPKERLLKTYHRPRPSLHLLQGKEQQPAQKSRRESYAKFYD